MNKKADIVLLIDNSNTRTKMMFSVDGVLRDQVLVMPTADVNQQSLLLVAEKYHFDRVVVSSVVPAAAAEICRAFAGKVSLLTVDNQLNFDYEYRGRATLGADRIANVAAVVQKGYAPCIAVDLGTAVTFDVVIPGQEKPLFIGGAIAPGLAGMARYLSVNTAQLPAVNLSGDFRAIGRDTVEAIQSGCLLGFCGMVREILNSIVAELGQRPKIVATGGDAELIAKYLHEIDEVDPLLTFKGLKVVADYVC